MKVMPPTDETFCPPFLLLRFWESEAAIYVNLTRERMNLGRVQLSKGNGVDFNTPEISALLNSPLCYYAAVRKKKDKQNQSGRHVGVIVMQAFVRLVPGAHRQIPSFRKMRGDMLQLASLHSAF